MGRREGRTHLVFKGIALGFGRQAVEREGDVVHLVAQAEYRFDGRIGYIQTAVVPVFLRVPHTHDGERQVADLDTLSEQLVVIRVAGKEVLGMQMRNDDDLALFGDIPVVDEAAGEHLHPVHFHVARERSVERYIVEIAAAVGHRVAAPAEGGRDQVHLIGEPGLAENVDILVRDADAASLLETVVRLGGYTAAHHHRIGGKVVTVVQEGVEQAVAGAQQHDQHEDAPRDGQAGQAGTHLVAPQ